MGDEGQIQAATALALRLEQEAVGGELDDYVRIVQNLGDCLSMKGDEEGLGAVKAARRTTMAMKKGSKVKKSQLDPAAMSRARKEAKKTYKSRKTEYNAAWDLETVRLSVKNKPRSGSPRK